MNTPFEFDNLDARTRALMIEEIQMAITTGNLYYSSRFTAIGDNQWPALLKAAASSHDEVWLAEQLEMIGAMKNSEPHRIRRGGYSSYDVPERASETLADGQFNRHYIAAICRRAVEDKVASVTVVRAKQRRHPRRESEALIGTTLDARGLLEEVRSLDSALQCELLQPNSGLSVAYAPGN